jgi:hypothetical protein
MTARGVPGHRQEATKAISAAGQKPDDALDPARQLFGLVTRTMSLILTKKSF